MNHHLEASLTSISRTLGNDCTLNALLAVQERVEIALKNEKLTKEIKDLIQSCKTGSRYGSDENGIKLETQLVGTSFRRNRHHYKVTNNKEGDLWVCGMSEKMRSKIPNYSDNVVLGAFLAGVDQSSIEAAVSHHKDFIEETLGNLSINLKWYMKDFVSYYQEQDEDLDEWQIKNLSSDLNNISYGVSNAKKVIQFNVSSEVEKLCDSIKNVKSLNVVNKESKEIVDFKDNMLNLILKLDGICVPEVTKELTQEGLGSLKIRKLGKYKL